MTVVSPVLSVLSPTPDESVKNAILAMTPKAKESKTISTLLLDKDGKEIKEIAEMFKPKEVPMIKIANAKSSVLPYDVFEGSTVKTVEPQAYKEAKFMQMFKSMTPPETTIKDVIPEPQKGFWASVKKHPVISTIVGIAAIGGGVWALSRNKEEQQEEYKEAS